MGGGVVILRVTVVVAQLIMTLSPVPDVYKVHKRKTSGDMIVLPLVCMAGSNYVWYALSLSRQSDLYRTPSTDNCHSPVPFEILRCLYAYLSNSIFPLFCSSLFAMLSGMTYTAVFFRWTSNRTYVLKLCAVSLAGCIAVSIYVAQGLAEVEGQTKAQVTNVLGYIGVAVSICLFASPLESLWQVVRTKSSASVPINFSVMMFVATALWVAAALLDSDIFVLVPNVFGVLLSAIQIVLFFAYRQPPSMATGLESAGGVSEGQLVIAISPNEEDLLAADKTPVYQVLRSPLVSGTRIT
ncbi:hypothetical protein BBJ28_00024234 [Nothophytophthora sp. Chile5]|nr:hypothetical protein BBJ28_00024234 [Nothophytophthora sp. Chile5]